MNRGYIKLWRKSLDNDMIRNPVAWQLMTWCLLKAAYKQKQTVVGSSIVNLEPGQLFLGRQMLAREIGTTERKIRTALDLLKKAGFLTSKTTSKGTVITIVNWHIYQDERPADDQQNVQPGDQQTTSKTTTNKEEKKVKNKDNKKVSKKAAPSYDELVDEYTQSPELKKAFGDFIVMRKQGKQPFTNAALARTFTELEKLAPGDDRQKAEILWQSVQRGWTGVFPLKSSQQDSRASPAPSPQSWIDRQNEQTRREIEELERRGLTQ